MAKMWPKEVPSWVVANKRRSAEIKVFRKLQEELNDEWEVFYSRPWWGIGRNGEEVDGEADFILVNPDRGLLFIEVKGGQIEYDPSKEQWSTTDRFGGRYKIKNPVEQAKTCRYRFFERLKNNPSWPRQRIKFRYGVIFTDTKEPHSSTKTIGPYERDLFCHEKEFDLALSEWISHRLRDLPDSREIGPGSDGSEIIRTLLASPISLSTTLNRSSEANIKEMSDLLTGAQLHVILDIWDEHRSIINGGAGTGKTTISCELAIRKSNAGKKVIWLCKSVALGKKVAQFLNSYENIEVIVHAGRIEELPTLDCLVIDEGQDLPDEFWRKLNNSLKVDQQLFVFADSNQCIYRRPTDLASQIKANEHVLRLNLRNTDQIAKVTNGLYEGPLIYSSGINGDFPQIYENTSEKERIVEVIQLCKKLLFEELVQMHDIAILCDDDEFAKKIRSELGRERMPSSTSRDSGVTLIVDTITNFKGLESAFVILVLSKSTARNQEHSYVGISRARTHLFIIGNITNTDLSHALEGARIEFAK
jgi:hypothetical protein